jgi:uncharacterized protein YbaA (DUF1428 family)
VTDVTWKTLGGHEKIPGCTGIFSSARIVFRSEDAVEAAPSKSKRRMIMTYVEGFVAAVPAVNKDAYLKHAAAAAELFKEFGASRIVETWGDDVPDGEITDFKGAVKAKPGEVIVFSWHEYPSKEVAEGAYKKMMSDPRMQEIGANMPFDGQRMIYGGFKSTLDENTGGKTGYVDGSLIAVPTANKDAYCELARQMTAVIMEYGATRIVDAWGDEVPDGKITDCKGAVKAGSDETVVYSWIEWPSKEIRDAGWEKVIADPRMYAEPEPYDNRRRVHGGFVPLLDA